MDLKNQKNKIELLKQDDQYIGYFFEGEDPRNCEKLLSFSRVNGGFDKFDPMIYQFGETRDLAVSSIALPGAKKIMARDLSLNEELGFAVDRKKIDGINDMINDLTRYNEFFVDELRRTQDIGNYSETVAYYIAMGKDPDTIPSQGGKNGIVKSELGLEMGLRMGKEIKNLMDSLEEPILYTQVGVASKKIRMMGLIDFLIQDKNGDFYLIDTKSGSPVKGKKLDNVIDQVLGTYGMMVEESFGRIPKGHYCISGFLDKKPKDEFDEYFYIDSATIDLDKKVLARRAKPNTRQKVIDNFMKKVEFYQIALKNRWI